MTRRPVADACCEAPAVVGVEIQGVYDGVLFWRCTACGTASHRWPAGHYLRERAARFVEAPRA
jgi:hypothetical protein